MSPSPSLLVLGSGDEADKGFILAALRRTGLRIILVSPDLTWEKPYVARHVGLNWDDARQGDELFLVAQAEGSSGVFTFSEHWVPLAAALAERLSLPGPGARAGQLARNKRLMRAAFAASGVPSPVSIPVSTAADAAQAAQHIGYPVIIKPEAGLGSVAVVRVDTPSELASQFHQARAVCMAEGLSDAFLVEEYVDGPEFSVEGLVYQGEFIPVAVTDKLLGPAPYFEEIGHMVPADLTHPDRQAAVAAVAQGVAALRLENCAVHGEVRLSGAGPRVIEIAARLGGDLIPELVRHATGIDFTAAAIGVALGKRPQVTSRRQRRAAVRFLVPSQAGQLMTVTGLQDAQKLPGVVGAVIVAAPGDRVDVPPRVYRQRLGAIMAVTGPEGEPRALLQEATRRIHITVAQEVVHHES